MRNDLVLENASIWLGHSFAKRLTIRGGRIASIDEAAPGGARVLDLGGRLVVPGFIDNHLHFILGSRQLAGLSLRDATSVDAFAARLREHASRRPAGEWITGGEWDEQRWNPPALPTRETLDAAAPHNPVFVTRLDLHMGIANGAALALAGITRDTRDPEGGAIGRDAGGTPNGVLKDAAMQLVRAVIPPPSLDERAEAMRTGLREAARCGVTAFCDMGLSDEAFDDLRAYQRCARAGALTARVWMYLPISRWQRLGDLGVEKGFGSDRLRIAGLKGFADGSLGSATAAFHQPFEDDPSNRGLLMKEMLDGSMARWIEDADGRELQLAIHAIGDRANDAVLSILERRPNARARRFRIEHAQHLDASLIARFARAGVIASAQPFHAADDGRWAAAKIGATRAAYAFPFRSLLDAGATVTFGSDWPVAPLSPLAGLRAAVTRRTIDGANPGGWIPEQRISAQEAMRCYTANNAYALFAEHELGAIAPGMRADLAVLSRNLFAIPPDELESVDVAMTIAGGEVVFEA